MRVLENGAIGIPTKTVQELVEEESWWNLESVKMVIVLDLPKGTPAATPKNVPQTPKISDLNNVKSSTRFHSNGNCMTGFHT